MKYPDFFDQAPTVTLRDPLSAFLGSFDEGLVEYKYVDAVKLAGHSCPTVAGAYLMTVKAIKALYGDEVPERGAIRASFPDSLDEGVTGVMASVITLLTGATAESGFKGIGPNFDRRDLLSFDMEMDCDIAFERVDTGARVEVTFAAYTVPMEEQTRGLLGQLISGQGDSETAQKFQSQWQERVRKILVDHVNDETLIQVRKTN
ncbi:MAG: hypothetical protein OQJ97_04400 [Rhodospirillales bacterium]|nr:hypothetical protein [Rhodospirillales bacterium]